MSRLFPALASPVPAPEAKAASSTPTFNAPGITGRIYQTSWSADRLIREGMERVTWVYRVLHVRASKSAGLPMVVRRDNAEDGEEVADHPLLPLLNAYATPDPSGNRSAFSFRYRLSLICDLNDQGAFVEVVRNNLGDPMALAILPVGMTFPVPGRTSFVDHYEVRVPGLTTTILKPEDVVWVKHEHPTDPYKGITPFQAAGIAIDSEWAAKLYQRNFLKNNASLGGFLLIAGEVSSDDVEELQARIDSRSGPAASGRWMVMEATQLDAGGEATGEVGGIKPVPGSVTPQEAAYIEMRKYTKEEIFGAGGVPISIGAANASDRTFENADAEYLTFWRDTMVEHCRMLARPFDHVDNDPTTFVAHDFSSVWVLQRDRIERERHEIALVAGKLVSKNEARDEIGRDPLASGGDDILDAINLTPVASTIGDITTPAPAPADTTKALSDDVTFGRWTVSAKRLKDRRAERLRQIITFEKLAKRVMTSFFRRQERAVQEKLRGRKAREGTRHWRGELASALENGQPVPIAGGSLELRGLDAADIFDRERWDKQIIEDMGSVIASIAEHFGEDAFDTIMGASKAEVKDDAPAFDAEEPRLLQFLRARGNKIKGINDETYDQIARQLAAGEAAGETITELAARVTSVFDEAKGTRSETIARTETISAANFGAIEGAVQSGVVQTKTWLATEDDRTRETHSEADGQTVALDDLFEVGDDTLDFPGDPDGSPEETINCRCTITFEVEEGPLL